MPEFIYTPNKGAALVAAGRTKCAPGAYVTVRAHVRVAAHAMGAHAHAQIVSTAAADPSPGGHRFTVAEAAAASGVSRRTIQRALPQLIEHGAERAGAAWSIPYAALVAAGFHPGKASAQTPAPSARSAAQRAAQEGDTPMRAPSAPRSAPLGSRMLDPTELTVELLTVRVQLEAAQQRAADLTRQLDRAYAEADAWRVMATHQLLQAPASEQVPEPTSDADADVSSAAPVVEGADAPTDPLAGSPAVSQTPEPVEPRRHWWQRRR